MADAAAEPRLICSLADCGAHGPSVKKAKWLIDGDLKAVYIEVASTKGQLYTAIGKGGKIY